MAANPHIDEADIKCRLFADVKITRPGAD